MGWLARVCWLMVSPPNVFWTNASTASVRVPRVTPRFLGFADRHLLRVRQRATSAALRHRRNRIALDGLGFLHEVAQMIRSPHKFCRYSRSLTDAPQTIP